MFIDPPSLTRKRERQMFTFGTVSVSARCTLRIHFLSGRKEEEEEDPRKHVWGKSRRKLTILANARSLVRLLKCYYGGLLRYVKYKSGQTHANYQLVTNSFVYHC